MLALCIGGAECVWDDLARFGEFHCEPDLVVACNDIITKWPDRLDAAVSMHPEQMGRWLRERAINHLPPPARVFAHLYAHDVYTAFERVPHLFDGATESGSSGLFCVQVAMQQLGATKVVCAGMPMDGAPHFYGGKGWDGAQLHRVGWRQALPHLANVRSMSGWTRELVGAPTKEWIDGKDHLLRAG